MRGRKRNKEGAVGKDGIMKKCKSLLASLLAVSGVTSAAVPAMAAEKAELTVSERLEKAVVYMKDTYKESFVSGDMKANMWTLLCAAGADKAGDAEYAFLIPDTDVSWLGETSSLGDYATTIMSLLLLQQNPADMGGRNLVQELADKQEEKGGFTGPAGAATANELPFVLAALDLAGADYNAQGGLDSLTALRKADGGYSWDSSAAESNVDTAGLALFAMADVELAKGMLQPTIDYLKGTINADGYFVGKDAYATANACSQASAVAGLAAAGADMSGADYAPAVQALFAFQNEDGGFLYDSEADQPDYYSTYQGALALTALKLADGSRPPVEDTATSSETTAEGTGTTDSAASGDSDTVKPAGTGSSQSGNHRTGDAGLHPLIIVVLVVAVAAVAACVVAPMVKKKKNTNDRGDDDFSDSDE